MVDNVWHVLGDSLRATESFKYLLLASFRCFFYSKRSPLNASKQLLLAVSLVATCLGTCIHTEQTGRQHTQTGFIFHMASLWSTRLWSFFEGQSPSHTSIIYVLKSWKGMMWDCNYVVYSSILKLSLPLSLSLHRVMWVLWGLFGSCQAESTVPNQFLSPRSRGSKVCMMQRT